MKFISVRELRNNPGEVWEELREQDLVLTSNGKPVGILLGVAEEELGETLESVRRVRAMQAVSRMRRRAAESGLDRLAPDEIEAEVRAVRRSR
jgi:prevent-host-death family protein